MTIVAIDLNRLKATNDEAGHAAGDALLRRAGEVLGKAADKPACAARIGGDEFVLLMPGDDERAGAAMIERIQSLVDLNNQYYPGALLSLAMGCATARAGERLEAMVSRADERMYAAKRDFYTQSGMDRPHAGRHPLRGLTRSTASTGHPPASRRHDLRCRARALVHRLLEHRVARQVGVREVHAALRRRQRAQRRAAAHAGHRHAHRMAVAHQVDAAAACRGRSGWARGEVVDHRAAPRPPTARSAAGRAAPQLAGVSPPSAQ